MNNLQNNSLSFLLLVFLLISCFCSLAFAQDTTPNAIHRNISTIVWTDVHWSTNKARVNDLISVTGKLQLFGGESAAVSKTAKVYLDIERPKNSLVLAETSIGGQLANSPVYLLIDKTYDFSMVTKARRPGEWNIHTSMFLDGIGMIEGPGTNIAIEDTDTIASFKSPITTLTGETIDLETYDENNKIFWRIFWAAIGIAWLAYWIRRPVFVPRILETFVKTQRSKKVLINAKRKASILAEVSFLAIVGFFLVWWWNADKKEYSTSIPVQEKNIPVIKPIEMPPDDVTKPEWMNMQLSTPAVIGYGSVIEILALLNLTKHPLESMRELNVHEKRKIDELVASITATAKLKGPEFTIETLTEEDKPLKYKDNTEWVWKWTVHPKEAGKKKQLFLNVNVNYQEKGRNKTASQLLDGKLHVGFSSWYDYYVWVKDNKEIVAMVTTMFGASIVFLVKLFMSLKKIHISD